MANYKSYKKNDSAPAGNNSGSSQPSHVVRLYLPEGVDDGNEGKGIRLTGLFTNTSKGGQDYMSGSTQEEIVLPAGTRFTVFPNTPK